MKATMSLLGMIDLRVALHNRVDEAKREFRSSRYCAGTSVKAKQAWVNPVSGEVVQTESAYEVGGKLVPVASVKDALKAKYGGQSGTLRQAVFYGPMLPPFPIHYDGSHYAVEFPLKDGKRDVSTEKLKIAAYMMERLAAGEMMVARLTYTHTYGVAQRLVQFSMEHGKVNARGLLYPTDVMDNDYPNAAVATLKLSEAERKVLSALWAKEAITPEDNISAEIQSTLAQADGGIVVSAQPEMPTEATLIEMLAAAGVPEATA